MIKKIIKITLLSFLALFVILAAAVSFLITTTPGVYATFKIVNLVTPSRLTISKADGRLIDGLTFKELIFEDDSQKIQLENGVLKWRAMDLLHGQLSIEKFSVSRLHLKTYEPDETVEDTAETASKLPELPVNIDIKVLEIDQFVIQHQDESQSLNYIHAQLKFNENKWSIDHLALEHDKIRHILKARLKPTYPYNLAASLKSSGVINQESLSASVDVTGDYDTYVLSGEIKGPLKAKVKGQLKKLNDIEAQASWINAGWPISDKDTFLSQSGQLHINGRLSDMLVTLTAQVKKPLTATLNLDAHITNQLITSTLNLNTLEGEAQSQIEYTLGQKPRIKGDLLAKNLNLYSLGIPIDRLDLSARFNGSNQQDIEGQAKLKGSYNKNILKGEASINEEKISAYLSLGPNHISIQGQPKYLWNIDGLIARPDILHPSLKGLSTNLKLQGQLSGPQKGQFTFDVGSGVYKAPDSQNLSPIRFNGGKIQANLTQSGLTTSGKITLDSSKFVFIDLKLPGYHLNAPSKPNQPIDGRVQLSIDSLDFLNNISPDVRRVSGRVSAVSEINGTLSNPIMSGKIELAGGSVYLPKADISYSPITAVLETNRKSWRLKSQITAKGQTLTINGQGQLAPKLLGQVQINATNFPAIQTAEYDISASPNLNVKFAPDSVNITGDIIIPKAELKPMSFSGSQSLSEDVVFVRDKKQSEPIDVSADVNLKMGNDVQLNVKGLTGQLTGGIRIRKDNGSTPFAVGELRIKDGKYQAYGQDLTIQEGQLLFSGGVITNPGIRVRAVRYFNNASSRFASSDEMFDFSSGNVDSWGFGDKVTVGIQVSGRVKNPDIELFSIPSSMSQADVLSMLILGKPSGQAGQSGGTLLLAALSAMNLDSGTEGTQLLGQLKQNLGIDFNIESSSSYDQVTNEASDSTSVVIGKAISKRLYLSYNVGLFQDDGGVFTIKYILNRYFNIQVNASDSGSGIDFLYNHSKE